MRLARFNIQSSGGGDKRYFVDFGRTVVGGVQFKLSGTGGEAVEYVGEWDLPLNRVLYKAFDMYMRRR